MRPVKTASGQASRKAGSIGPSPTKMNRCDRPSLCSSEPSGSTIANPFSAEIRPAYRIAGRFSQTCQESRNAADRFTGENRSVSTPRAHTARRSAGHPLRTRRSLVSADGTSTRRHAPYSQRM
jgi:hypothetical protein